MKNPLVPVLLFSSLAANADILTSTQRFFGMAGQIPDYSEETQPTALNQAPYSPSDSDLGVQEILVDRPDRAPVYLDVGTAILRTDNAPSGTGDDRSSWVSASNIAVTWRPHLYHGVFWDLGLGEEILRYDRTNASDYENFNARVGVFKVPTLLHDIAVFARYEYQRITSSSIREGDYNAQRIRAGLQKVLWSTPRHQVASNINGTYEWTARPELLQRNEVSVEASYSYSISNCLYTVASARVSRFNYDQFGRDDWTYGMALELIYQVSENFNANAGVFFDKNESDTFGSFNEYEAWSGGVGITAQWTF